MRLLLLLALMCLIASGCSKAPVTPVQPALPTFADEVNFLKDHGDVIILTSPSGGLVALSAAYQGRVMTSAVQQDAPALGWINHAFIREGKTGTAFDNFGGEDRFWLGPEGGQYGLYFPPGSTFTFDAWQVPHTMQEGAWDVTAQSDTSVTFARTMEVINYSGTAFNVQVERIVRLLSAAELTDAIGAVPSSGMKHVAYETVNRVTNVGSTAWQKNNGLPSIWILSMFEPFDTTYIVVPFKRTEGNVALTDDYFGKIPAERLAVKDDYLVFLADGTSRGKLGLGPASARPVMGSYTPSQNMLTLVRYTLPEGATDYVNSLWETQEKPFSGDAMNAYNDGPVAPGQPALGGFYEMESSSPALALKPGESYTHIHRTVHLVGGTEMLDPIATAQLGVGLTDVTSALK